MSFRDDLAAAHARIEALTAELERVNAECEKLRRLNVELEADAKIGRRYRVQREEPFDEERLREQMKREEAEVEEKIRAMRETLREQNDD
jgi:hypothetical protein